jgi:hypothetical protein
MRQLALDVGEFLGDLAVPDREQVYTTHVAA